MLSTVKLGNFDGTLVASGIAFLASHAHVAPRDPFDPQGSYRHAT